uniref:Capsid protein n=1 Tax=Hubei noda-like virus 19 TaxID=1922974 RepID=A0A1L3KGF8_9VIRU|nr:hypothetical protein 2 [Hubei noda-like virus 19]
MALTVRNKKGLAQMVDMATVNTGRQIASEIFRAFRGREPAPPPRAPRARPQKQQNRQRQPRQEKSGKITTLATPNNFGTSSNNLVRSQILSSTANSVVMRGTTILGQVATGANISSTQPNCAFFASSNPITFDDRMQTIASTFDKYVYRWVKLRWVPQVGTTTVGTVMIAIDRDYTDPPQTLSLASSQSYEAVAMGSVFAKQECTMRRDTHELRTYFTNFLSDVNIRDSEQFKFYVYTSGVAGGLPIGNLVLDYELELISPVFSPSELGANISKLGVFSVTTGTVATTAGFSAPTNSGNWNLGTALISPADAGVGNLVEFVFQLPTTAVNVGSALLLGLNGSQWQPTSAGSVVLYGTVNASSISDTIFYLYPDLSSAIRGNGPTTTSVPSLYNQSTATRNLFVFTTYSFTYRWLSYSTATTI